MRLRAVVVLLGVLLLAGCTTRHVALKPEQKQKIKTVALVEVAEPDPYVLHPGQGAPMAGMLVLGAFGAMLGAGIEQEFVDRASKELMASYGSQPPAAATSLGNGFHSAMQAKGYSMARLPPMPKREKGEPIIFNCPPHPGQYDAIVMMLYSAGYLVMHGGVEPRVAVDVKIMNSDCSETLYTSSLYYGVNMIDTVVIPKDPAMRFASREELLANPEKSREYLRTITRRMQDRIVADF